MFRVISVLAIDWSFQKNKYFLINYGFFSYTSLQIIGCYLTFFVKYFFIIALLCLLDVCMS